MTDSATTPSLSEAPTRTTVCISGGGPAGMMLGLLLARAGIRVTVLEKHQDFFRDFRGDTIHTSTLELMRELGLLDEFLKLPHHKVYSIGGSFGGESITFGDFRTLPTQCKFVAFMPQWDFLDFLKRQAARYPEFTLLMQAEAIALLRAKNDSYGAGSAGCAGAMPGTGNMRSRRVWSWPATGATPRCGSRAACR